jgi:hypothetical protein
MNHYYSPDYVYESYENDTIIDDTDDDYGSEYSIESNTPFRYVDQEDYSISRIINQEDSEHYYSEKENNHYYIGIPMDMNEDYYILANSVSPKLFLKYSYKQILYYLWSHCVISIVYPRIEILKLKIHSDGTYYVIVKTYWIRIVQRRWKTIFKQRREIIQKQKKMFSLYHREIKGRFPQGANHLPGIKGMMFTYQKSSNKEID